MQESKTYTPKHIEISEALLEFLTPAKSDNAYSRCDAFLDLVARASSSNGHKSFMGYDFDLRPGEFIITMSDLAKVWNWYRRTVRFFIEDLEGLGVLQVISYKKFWQIDMVALRFTTSFDAIQDSAEIKEYIIPNVPHVESQNVPHVDDANVPLETQENSSETCGAFCQKFDFNPVGTHLYSAEQRKELADVALTVVSPLYHSLLKSIYTPRAEKILLDTLFKRCNGNVVEFSEIIRKLAEDVNVGLSAKNITAAIESLAMASEIASVASNTPEAVDSTPKTPKAKRARKTKAKQ